MLNTHKGHTDTIQVYSVTVMTHVKALQAGHSSQGTSEPITPASGSRLGPARSDWTTIVCFSCGKPGHGVGRCLELDETFPYMLPGWSVRRWVLIT